VLDTPQPGLLSLSKGEKREFVSNLETLSDVLAFQIYHENADVRKCIVFCLVEIHSVMEDEERFRMIFMNKLNQSQQKLVDIYISRKQ